MGKPPDDLMTWPKGELAREVARLRAVLREHAEQPGTDPTSHNSPDPIIGGDPHEYGTALLDARSAVLFDGMEVVLVDTKRDEALSMMMSLRGRVNYSTNRVEHAYLFGPDGAAAIVSELVGLAARAGGGPEHGQRFAAEFQSLLDERMKALP